MSNIKAFLFSGKRKFLSIPLLVVFLLVFLSTFSQPTHKEVAGVHTVYTSAITPTKTVKPTPTETPTATPTPTPTLMPTVIYIPPTSAPTTSVDTSNSIQNNTQQNTQQQACSGATALCNDGTCSYAAHHQGACSHHQGVAQFYN